MVKFLKALSTSWIVALGVSPFVILASHDPVVLSMLFQVWAFSLACVWTRMAVEGRERPGDAVVAMACPVSAWTLVLLVSSQHDPEFALVLTFCLVALCLAELTCVAFMEA